MDVKDIPCAILLVLVILGIPILLAFLGEGRRTKVLRAIAASIGATFQRQVTAEKEALLAQSPLGSDGRIPSLTNIIEIAETGGLSIAVFDYFYDASTGLDRMSGRQTALQVQSRLLTLPEVVLRPGWFLYDIGKAFGLQEIDFPESSEFSKAFTVQGRDEAAVRGLFVPAVIQFCQGHPGIVLEGYGDRLLFYRPSQIVEPNAILPFIEAGKQLTARIFEPSGPRHRRD